MNSIYKLVLIIISSLFIQTVNAQEFVANISSTGLDFIKGQESFMAKPYYDHTGYAIGYGNQRLCNGKKVTANTKAITELEATRHLKCLIDTKNELLIHYYIDNRMEVSQDMHDAILSFTYNIGSYGALRSSTMKHLVQQNCYLAVHSMHAWVKASGKVLKGLVQRRHQESQMLLNGCKQVNESLGFEYYKVDKPKKKTKVKKKVSE